MKKGLLLIGVALLLTGCGGKELTKDEDIIKIHDLISNCYQDIMKIYIANTYWR